MRLWKGTEALHVCIVAIKNGVVKHLWSKNPDYSKYFEDGWDIYFGLSAFLARKRTQANAASSAAFWLDIDFEDFGGEKPTITSLTKFCADASLPSPNWVIHSGNGLHVYWVAEERVPKDKWVSMARSLKTLCVTHGFKADPARTTDIASILRVPGTLNFKDPGNPKNVTELISNPDIPLEVLERALPGVELPAASGGSEWSANPTACAETVAEKCAQIAQMRDTLGAMPEPLWRGCLSVVFRCAGGEKLVHEWSMGDERYTEQETRGKAENTAGPYTCQAFYDLEPDTCTRCKHWGKIPSPIVLGVAPEAPTEEPISRVGHFKITRAGVFFEPPDERPERVTEVPVWVEEIRERAREKEESNRASLLIGWRTVGGRKRTAVLYSQDLYDTKQFTAWLANENLRPLIQEVKALVLYISQYTKELLKKNSVRIYHERLGWHKNRKFILGKVAVTADGVEPALVQSTSPIAKLEEPKGDLSKWKEAVSCLKTPRLRKQAFALLAGFGSPLLDLVGWHSAVLSLTGPSGVGKTLAANLALSIYGKCECLSQASSATPNSIEGQLTRHRNVPYLLDEVTNMSGVRLANFIYTAANGQGKAALTQTREFREVGSWSLVAFITSNHPLLDLAINEVEEAHRRRLLEFYIAEEDSLTAAEGANLARALEHAGTPAIPFLQFVIKYQGMIMTLMEETYVEIQKNIPNVAADRFLLWTLTAAKVGGKIAHKLGLIDLDVDAVMQAAYDAQKEGLGTIETPEEICKQAIADFITEHSPEIVFWKERDTFASDAPQHKAPLIRDFGDGVVAIHGKALGDYLTKQKIARRVFNRVVHEGAYDPGKVVAVVRLSPHLPVVRCFKIDLEKLGLTQILPKPGLKVVKQ